MADFLSEERKLEEILAADIGLFVQAVAALELFVDDLMGLANDRFDGSERLQSRYPDKLSDKLKLLPAIAELAGHDSGSVPNIEELGQVLELRHRLVHGKVISLRASGDGYAIQIAKTGRPKPQGNSQSILRDVASYVLRDFALRAAEIHDARLRLEELRKAVFIAGEGWPNFLVLPEGDPLSTERLHEAMVKYA